MATNWAIAIIAVAQIYCWSRAYGIVVDDAVSSAPAVDLGHRYDSDRPVRRHLVLHRRRGPRRGAVCTSSTRPARRRDRRSRARNCRARGRAVWIRAAVELRPADGPWTRAIVCRP